MLVKRDLLDSLQSTKTLEAVLVWGPRQVGKTTLLMETAPKTVLFLDDLGVRTRAQTDPALLFEGQEHPILVDEVQYAPNLFPEIKLRIDAARRKGNRNLKFWLTGSNRTLLDRNLKESLAGRCSRFALSGFSVKEIISHYGEVPIQTILTRGGFPELYVQEKLSPRRYLNDYIQSFVEKDIALSAGIEKLGEFQTLLQLLAARTGQFIQYDEIGNAAGIDIKTVKRWISLLEQNMVVHRLPPYSSNLTKRIVKMPKLFFQDVGLCARLQGHTGPDALWGSPQAGALFETLVHSEIKKTRDNFLKDWKLYSWRTKEKEEVDFILEKEDSTVFIEAKLGIHGAKPFDLDREARKVFKEKHQKIVVTVGGKKEAIGAEVLRVPIQELGKFLLHDSP